MRLEHKGTLMPPPKSSQLSPPRASQHYGAGADPHLAGVRAAGQLAQHRPSLLRFDARIERRGDWLCGAGNAAGPRRVKCVRQRDQSFSHIVQSLPVVVQTFFKVYTRGALLPA